MPPSHLTLLKPPLGQLELSLAAPTWALRDGASAALGRAAAQFEEACELESKNPELARVTYEKALADDPRHQAALINLGRLLHEHGHPAHAERHYRRAVELDPTNATARFNLGTALEDLGRPAEAIAEYDRAVALEPRFADGHFNLSRLLEVQGDRPAALRHLAAYRRLTQGA